MPQVEAIADVLIAGQKELGRMKFTDIASKLRRYVAMPGLIKQEKVGFSDGHQIQFQIKVTQAGSARATAPYASDVVNVTDTLKSATVPWKHVTANYAFDEFEMMVVSGQSEILDLMKSRRYDCMLDLAELMETYFWSLSTLNSDNPWGVPNYIVKNNTTGFNGGHPTGYSDVAGVSRTTYTAWKNYTAQYAAISKTDLIRKWRRAARETKFKPSVDYPSYNRGDHYGYYTNLDVVLESEELLEAQNDNLGPDIASMDGELLFRRIQVTDVPKLADDADDPIYGINWGVFHPIFHRKRFMREKGPTIVPGQHTVFATHVDLTYNIECRNCREQFVIAKDTTGGI